MAKAIVLDVQPRTPGERKISRKLREQGQLPGVIYGKGIDTAHLTVPRHEFIRLLHGHGSHALVTLRIEGGQEYLALVKEVQIDPVRQEALHVDFVRVKEDEAVHTEAVIHIVGEPVGVKLGGGVLEVQIRSVQIAALPRSIPESIDFDVSALEIGDVARVGDIVAPEGVTILTDPEETLAGVAAPRTEAEQAEATTTTESDDAVAETETAEGDDADAASESEGS